MSRATCGGPRPWLALCALLAPVAGAVVTVNSRPSVLLLVADDLGIGDLGCYGNSTMNTPHLDRLAREGVRLTQHLAAASVCSPSRAAFLTGRYAVRSGMASDSELHRSLSWLAASGGLPGNETTLAEVLQQRGYRTGLIGKWHLGLSCAARGDHCHHPLSQGFEHFFGLPLGLRNECSGRASELHPGVRAGLWAATAALSLPPALLLLPLLASAGCRRRPAPLLAAAALSALLALLFFAAWFSSYGLARRWNCVLMRGHHVVQQPADPARLGAMMLRDALRFLDRHQRAPFLLLVSFLHVHTPLPTRASFVGRSKHGPYGDNVEELDWMVGKILEALDREQLTNSTLVYFTSDNGGREEAADGEARLGGWNGVYRGGRGSGGWEGGIRVPGIFRWPAVLEAGAVIDEPTSHMDLLPTLAYLAGGTLPQDRVIDGRNLMPLLEGRAAHSEHEFLFHYCGRRLHSARWHQRDCGTVWKAHFVTSRPGSHACSGAVTLHDPPLLFDLTRDPGERRPLDAEAEAGLASVLRRLEAARAAHEAAMTPGPPALTPARDLWLPWLQPCCGRACACDRAR